MKPHVPIMTTVPESNIVNNCDIFDLFIRTSDLACRGSPWHGKIKGESENIVENIGGKKVKNAERKNNSEVENLGVKIL